MSPRPASPRPGLLGLLLLLVTTACSGIQVATDHDPSRDFSAYATYTLVDKTPDAEVTELVIERLHDAIVAELDGKDLREATADPDLLVLYHVALTDELQVNDPYFSYHATEVYTVGTLVIDLVDTDGDRLVWTGTASIRLKELKTPEERAKRVQRVVKAILDRYPPR